MPELPEVETIVRDLNKILPGKVFSQISVLDSLVLRQKPQDFVRQLKGTSVKRVCRRGKAIIVELSSGRFLIVQLMMTGQLVLNGEDDKHSRVRFIFDDKSKLSYNDQRRFGQLRVVKNLDEVKHFNILGPEPFSKEFTPHLIFEALRKSIRPIKNVLLDHTVVAGIGNIYACEILFRSHISPKRQARRIKLSEAQKIHEDIREVLDEAIFHRGSSMRNYRDSAGEKGKFNELLKVYGRQAEPCVTCQKPILRIVQAGRSTFYCGHCQK